MIDKEKSYTLSELLDNYGMMNIEFKFYGNNDDGEQQDLNKTQLYVSNYDGGFGDEWLYSAKANFEKLYENEVFEEGKKGVQVWITPSELNGPALINSVLGAREQVFIAQSVYYYDYLTEECMLDISDVVTGSLSVFGENNTIENKLIL